MSTDLHRPPARQAADLQRALAYVKPRLETIRRNIASSWRFVTGRRRDLRFAVQPYDTFQIAGAAALTATALVLLILVADPFVPAWRETLPPSVVAFFSFFTQFGKADWILIATGAATIIAHLIDASATPKRERITRATRVTAAAYVFLTVAISGITANLTKYALGRARPKLFEEHGSTAFDFWAWDPDWASFPSGHATTGMALGVSLALLFPRLKWVFLCLGFWIAASRPFVGAHYASDMLAGCLLGGLIAWLLARALARRRLIFGFDREGRLISRPGASGLK